MTNKRRVACFFTGGYTELNAMKAFIKKINANAEYIQLCPNAPRKSRDAIRKRVSITSDQSGLSGDSLINYVLEFVGKSRFTEESYDAILIEDDKDSRFINKGTLEIALEEWETFKSDVEHRLKGKGVTIPVIILLAAPEIEAWFVSDWKNGFGQVYEKTHILNGRQNRYFSEVFHKYVEEEILTSQYSRAVESYGYFDRKYKKLSEEIQNALSNHDFMAKYAPHFEHEPIHYSKRKQGEVMLENIDPNVVLRSCTSFFKEGFLKIQNI